MNQPPEPASAPVTADPMIDVRDLKKSYGPIQAVRGVSFELAPGEILGFLGPNGAGKSTTMRMLTCYTPPTSGTALVGGCDIRKQSLEVRRQIGYLPESAPLYTDMKVRDYLKFMVQVKRYPRARHKRYIDEALEECGLTDVQHRLIANLSKGYRQRVGLAQALIGDPRVLVLDEPTVGLDPAQIQEIRNLIKRMAGRRTVILSTHILPEVSMTCQRVIIINRGRVEAQGTPESLTSELAGDNIILLTVEGERDDVLGRLQAVPGVSSAVLDHPLGERSARYRIQSRVGEDPRPALARTIIEGGHQLLEQQSTGLSLEDIFMRVISTQEEEVA